MRRLAVASRQESGRRHVSTDNSLISIHSSLTFLADMYGFLDPPSRTVLFSVDDRSLFQVDCVTGERAANFRLLANQ